MWFSFLARFNSYYFAITFDFHYCIRADKSAHSAAGAVGIVCLCGKVTIFVGVSGDDDAIIRAYCYTQATALAPFGIDYYFAGHNLRDSNRAGRLCKVKRLICSLHKLDFGV